MNHNHVILVGALPPPVHGMAAVNAAVYEEFKNFGMQISVIDISAATLYRTLFMRLSRFPRVIAGLARFLFNPQFHGDTLYMSVSGGAGQLYELFFVWIARARGMHLYLHYHSFAYLDRYVRITDMLIRSGGPACTHITLSPMMADRLRSKYPAARKVAAVSNAVFFSDDAVEAQGNSRPPGLSTIGFLSNISDEKGIFDFLDLVAACEVAGLPLRAEIAGPFQDQATELRVRNRMKTVPSVTYVGALYGNRKKIFLNSIDALIFATRYVNEAEPLTLHEAMQNAVPVIAYGRGAIPEIVNSRCGLVIHPDAEFVPPALEKLREWLHSPETHEKASLNAREMFLATMAKSKNNWINLVCEITGERI